MHFCFDLTSWYYYLSSKKQVMLLQLLRIFNGVMSMYINHVITNLITQFILQCLSDKYLYTYVV